jgi:polysaccharide biosynthesis/export protein
MIARNRVWPLLLATALLPGCLHLPVDGPASRDIVGSASASLSTSSNAVVYDYALVDINSRVLDSLVDAGVDSFLKSFGRSAKWLGGSAPAIRIGKGDVLDISIFESSAGGLFLPPGADTRSGNYVRTPSQAVDSAGNIAVPYAGTIHAAGRTLPDIQHEIESKLKSRAIEPQVIITVVEQNTAAVTIIGDAVTGSNKFKLSGSGERILDMVSKAGGIRFPGFDVFVGLQRKNRLATVHFPVLVSNPNENIFAEPGDLIYVYRDQRRYVAAGAIGATSGGASIAGNNTLVGAVGQFSFDQERLSLNEAIAKAGGLIDSRADPAQVFLFRVENRETLEKIGVDLNRFPPDQKFVPTVYRANFRDPSSFFYTQRFPMRNKDIIYVGNSDATEFSKLLANVRDITSTVAGVAVDANTVAYHGP